jgi:hypothetical protein
LEAKKETEGIFVISDNTAAFRPVTTGIVGTADIELIEGLAENAEIVSGPYQVLRTLQDNTRIKIVK